MPHLIFIIVIWSMALPCMGGNTIEVKGDQGHYQIHWDAERTFSFSGEWFYFPDRWVSPKQVLNYQGQYPDDVKLVSGDLSYVSLGQSSHQGKGSYLIKLSGLPREEVIAMYHFIIYSSSRFYFFSEDGQGVIKPIESMGIDDESEKTEPIFSLKPYISFRTFGAQDHYLLIQTANYYHAWGGMWKKPRIGSQNAVGKVVQAGSIRDNMVIGLMLFVVVYNFAIFLRRREDLTSLALSLSALVFTIRTFVFHNFPHAIWGDPKTSFEVNNKILYIYWTMGTVSFLFFLNRAFPRQLSTRLFLAVLFTQLPVWLLISFTDVIQYYNIINPIIMIFTVLTPFFILWVLIRAYLKKEESVILILIGYVVGNFSGINDALWTLDLPYLYFPMLGIGYSIFFLFNSLVIAQRFATAFRNSERLGQELQVEVDRQTRDIRSILEGIKQGILTIIDRKAPIGRHHSQYLNELVVKKNVESMNIDELLFHRSSLSSDELNRIHACLDMSLKSDELNFEVNQHTLPRELPYKSFDGLEKVLNIDWNPVVDEEGCVEKILVTIRDVTELRALELENRKQEEDIRIFTELVKIPEDRFQRFVKKTLSYLQDNRQLIQLNSSLKKDVIRRLFINMHTIKGAARTYLLKALSDASHEVEQYYSRLEKGTGSWDQQLMLKEIDELENLVQEYQDIGEHKLGWQISNRTVRIPVHVIENMMKKINALVDKSFDKSQKKELSSCLWEVCNYGFVSIHSVFEEVCSGIDSMARDLGKEVPVVQIESIDIVLKDEGANLLHSILVHIIRNTMDHGIETPEQRKAYGKKQKGSIFLKVVTHDNGQLELLYRDDGAGLDIQKIRHLAEESQFDTTDLSDDDLVGLIFKSGFTTKGKVSDISGRGVGMAAAKLYMEDEGGRIDVRLLPENEKCAGRPFVISLILPEGLWVSSSGVTPIHAA